MAEMHEDSSEVELNTLMARYERRKRRLQRQLALSVVFFAVVGWYGWEQRDYIQYQLLTAEKLQDMGEAVGKAPADYPHNTYIQLRGITEHRGLKQLVLPAFSLQRQERWYFRLLGSQGVFIEVPPDADLYAFARRVTVQGRIVDPGKERRYASLLNAYRKQFHVTELGALRIIQVGVRPHTHAQRVWGVLVAVGMLALLNLVACMRWLKARRTLAAGGILR